MQTTQGGLNHYLNSDDLNHYLKTILQESPNQPYAIISLDFDNFNFINDMFSYEVGDEVLKRIMQHFSQSLSDKECFSRLHADHFIFFVHTQHTQNLIKRFSKMTDLRENLSDILPSHYNLVCSGGIVLMSEAFESFSVWLDKATFARKKAKGNHATTFLYFDKKMSDDLKWRKTITLMMEGALLNQEFEMYLQPKVLMQTGQVVGAEALVRWNSRDFGLIYPDQFIPIFEQNGFIKQLDFFMLEQACVFLKNDMKAGHKPLPISVNFSKTHLRNHGFVEKIFRIVNRHGVATKLIEIEVTENIYLDDFQALIEVASELKFLGFKVSLDDFGSAYSSLNYLKDLPLDIIKIDKGFLNSTENTDRGHIIIAKVIELIKSLRMIPIMEGVETKEQVDFLQKLSCDFGQGYFYAKPMPLSAYIEFIKNQSTLDNLEEYFVEQQQKEVENFREVVPQEFQMDNWELYTLGKNIDMGLMKGALDGDATVQYVNDRALEYLGYTREEFREIFHNSIVAFTHPDDADVVLENAKQLIKTGIPIQFQTRAIRKDGKVITLQGRSSCVIDSQGHPIGIYAFQDVSEELERTQHLQASFEHKIKELEDMVTKERKLREAFQTSEER